MSLIFFGDPSTYPSPDFKPDRGKPFIPYRKPKKVPFLSDMGEHRASKQVIQSIGGPCPMVRIGGRWVRFFTLRFIRVRLHLLSKPTFLRFKQAGCLMPAILTVNGFHTFRTANEIRVYEKAYAEHLAGYAKPAYTASLRRDIVSGISAIQQKVLNEGNGWMEPAEDLQAFLDSLNQMRESYYWFRCQNSDRSQYNPLLHYEEMDAMRMALGLKGNNYYESDDQDEQIVRRDLGQPDGEEQGPSYKE